MGVKQYHQVCGFENDRWAQIQVPRPENARRGNANASETGWQDCQKRQLPTAVSREVERAVPVVICCVRTGRAVDTGMETDEGPGSLRECAQCDPGDQVECATADGPVGVSGVENDVTVL